MKQNLFTKSVCGLAVVVCMTSCVAKKKYTEAQNQISQLQAENARLNESGTTMQTNITTLESQNRTLQSSLDSTNTWVSGQQTRWNSFQAFYDEGTKTVEQVHQQLHQQLDELIGTENITSANGRVHVNLSEKTLFASGSSRLSTKGAQILETLAMAIKDNPNVEIDIASAPGYYTAGSMSTTTNSTAMTTDATNTTTTTTTMDNTKMKTDEDGDVKMKSENTKVKMDRDGDVKVKTSANRSTSYSGAAKKTTTTSTARRSESKSKTYKSSPARKTAVSSSSKWSLNMARSSSIAKKLVDEGVAKSRILVAKDNGGDATTTKDYQIIISPKPDTYYQSIGNGNSGMNK